MCASSYRSGMIGWKGENKKGDRDFHTVKSIEKDGRLDSHTHNRTRMCRACNSGGSTCFPDFKLLGFLHFSPNPIARSPFFSYGTREGENWIFQLFKPVFPVPFDSLSSLKIAIKGKYTKCGQVFLEFKKKKKKKKKKKRSEKDKRIRNVHHQSMRSSTLYFIPEKPVRSSRFRACI
jgi:hypothetical protein